MEVNPHIQGLRRGSGRSTSNTQLMCVASEEKYKRIEEREKEVNDVECDLSLPSVILLYLSDQQSVFLLFIVFKNSCISLHLDFVDTPSASSSLT